MKFKDYQKLTSQFAIYPKETALEYLSLGLFSEVGEIAGLIKKKIRGDNLPDFDDLLKKELGDVAWYLSELANHIGDDDDVCRDTHLKKADKWSIVDAIAHIEDLVFDVNNISCSVVNQNKREIHENVLYAIESWVCMVLLFGFDVDEVLDLNIKKLSSRQERCVITGSGDNR